MQVGSVTNVRVGTCVHRILKTFQDSATFRDNLNCTNSSKFLIVHFLTHTHARSQSQAQIVEHTQKKKTKSASLSPYHQIVAGYTCHELCTQMSQAIPPLVTPDSPSLGQVTAAACVSLCIHSNVGCARSFPAHSAPKTQRPWRKHQCLAQIFWDMDQPGKCD